MRQGVPRTTRFLIAVAAMTIVPILLVAGAYLLTEAERLDIQRDSRQISELWAGATRLAGAVNAEETSIGGYLLSADAQAVVGFEAAAADENAIIAQMRAGTVELPALDGAITELEKATATWRSSFAQPAISAVRGGGGTALAPYTRDSGADAPMHAALARLANQLTLAEGDLKAREDGMTIVRTLATAFGLGVLLLSAALSVWRIRGYGRSVTKDALQADILNRFTEVTSFAADDSAVAQANLEALALLAHPNAGVAHVLNHSRDRAVPEATIGGAAAEVLPLAMLSTCAGLIRGSMYVSSDLAAPLSVHCPIYPADHGTLACVPLISGEQIGAVHLYWEEPHGLPLELRRNVGRIAEHAAMAIGNRRLLTALQGQASTDARTGLANSRAFDRAVEQALAARIADEPLAILMLDLDRFKDFNDRHGHPSGDEALRTFADVLRSCMRDGDLAARYGGEEFAVMLAGVAPTTAILIAERIRARTGSTVVSLAPGITDHITVSIGVACAPVQALDRVALLRIADQALYEAKAAGRNRVVYLGEQVPTLDPGAEVPDASSPRSGSGLGRVEGQSA